MKLDYANIKNARKNYFEIGNHTYTLAPFNKNQFFMPTGLMNVMVDENGKLYNVYKKDVLKVNMDAALKIF